MAAPFAKFLPEVSMPGLLKTVRAAFDTVPDTRRQASVKHSMSDTLLSALAMFSLKYPSLLKFDEDVRRGESDLVATNLKSLYELTSVPSDSQMRAILDPVNPAALRGAFRGIISGLQHHGAMRQMQVLDGQLLVAIDGTGSYASTNISCEDCLHKKISTAKQNKGCKHGDSIDASDEYGGGDGYEDEREAQAEAKTLLYHHQMVAAVAVHPDAERPSLPLDVEPITGRDGRDKNDCEHVAVGRLLDSLSGQYPKQRLLLVQDGLGANGPHVRRVLEHDMDFLIVARKEGNASLFKAVDARSDAEMQSWSVEADKDVGVLQHGFRIIHDVPLNDSHKDLLVNVLEYWEVDKKGKQHLWVWVTNLLPTKENAEAMMRAARARWRIENHTFLALKRQGYNYEHSYGHGKQHLQSVLGTLMVLALLIDQVQIGFCRVFQSIMVKRKRFSYLVEKMRAIFDLFEVGDWALFLSFLHTPALIHDENPKPLWDSRC